MSEQAQLAACQVYVNEHNIQQLVKDAIVQLCLHKPDNPVLFLRDHFAKIELERARAYQVRTSCLLYIISICYCICMPPTIHMLRR